MSEQVSDEVLFADEDDVNGEDELYCTFDGHVIGSECGYGGEWVNGRPFCDCHEELL